MGPQLPTRLPQTVTLCAGTEDIPYSRPHRYCHATGGRRYPQKFWDRGTGSCPALVPPAEPRASRHTMSRGGKATHSSGAPADGPRSSHHYLCDEAGNRRGPCGLSQKRGPIRPPLSCRSPRRNSVRLPGSLHVRRRSHHYRHDCLRHGNRQSRYSPDHPLQPP